MTERSGDRRSRGRPKSSWGEGDGATVQALDRGLWLLNALAREGAATLTELSMSVGVPASSAHRLLATLQKHHFVEFDEPTQTWSIGLQSFRVGAAFSRRTDLVEVGRRIMRGLMEETGETANLALADLSSGEVVFVSQVETANPIRAFFRIGARGPLHATGIGKALLAALPRAEVEEALQRRGLARFTDQTLISPQALFADLAAIKERGWSLDDEEHYAGMRCVAAAIRNAHGEPIAGVSVSGPRARISDTAAAEMGAKVMRAAADITRLTGGDAAPATAAE